jgi:hypothetical protein
MQAGVGFMSEDIALPVAHTVDAMDKWPGSQEPRETGFQIANKTTDTFFEYFAKHQNRLKRYGTAMAANATSEGYHVKNLVDNYPWDRLGEGTVVDLGGSQGHVSIAIATKYPSLKFIVQELPSMRPPSVSASVPAEFESQVSLTTHDFFDTQSVSADVYMYRWIFHNWSDAYAIKMLQALIPVLKPDAKVLINDVVLPEAGSVGLTEDKSIKFVVLYFLFVVAGQLMYSSGVGQWIFSNSF